MREPQSERGLGPAARESTGTAFASAGPECVVTLCCADRLGRDADRLAGRLRTAGFQVSIATGARARTLLLRAAPACDDRTDLYVVLVPDAREEAAMTRLRSKFPRPGWHGRHVMFVVLDGRHELRELAERVRSFVQAIDRLDRHRGPRDLAPDATTPAGVLIGAPGRRPSDVSTLSASRPSGSLAQIQAESRADWKPAGRPVPSPPSASTARGRVRRAKIAGFALSLPLALVAGWMWATRAGADPMNSDPHGDANKGVPREQVRDARGLPPVPDPWAAPRDPVTSSAGWWEPSDGRAPASLPPAFATAVDDGDVVESDTMFATRHRGDPTTSWRRAAKRCDDLALGGMQGWRLPTRREAQGLAVAGVLPGLPVWTRSVSYDDPDAVWVWDPARGMVPWLRAEPNAVSVCVISWDEVASFALPTPA